MEDETWADDCNVDASQQLDTHALLDRSLRLSRSCNLRHVPHSLGKLHGV